MASKAQTSSFNHWPWAVPSLLASLLIAISHYNYPLFHTLAEFLAIGIAITLAVVAWNMYPFTKNNFLMFLGIGYFWVAIIDLFHTLTYKDFGIFALTTPEYSIRLWLAARALEALVLLIACRYLNHSLRREPVLLIVGTVAMLMSLLAISTAFPDVFIEGIGLTPFKIIAEYTIISLLVIAALLLWRNRHLLEPKTQTMIFLAIAFTIAAELAFTLFVTLDATANLVGHIFKLFSFWLIFLATMRTTLERPFLAMARSANTYDAVPDATIVVDSNGIIQQANQAATALVQLPLADVLDQHCHQLYHPASTDNTLCPICEAIKHGRSIRNVELYAPTKNRFFDYALSPINISATQQGMVQTIRDITPRKAAENRLKESEQYNRMLFENSPIGLALCRMSGELVDINAAYASIIGRTISDTINCSYWDITPEKYYATEQAILKQLNQSGHYGPYEKEYIHRDGHLVPVRLNGMLLKKDNETYIWSSVEDIALQKKTQERLDFLAHHDPLTHLPNRLLLHDRLKHAIQVANRSGNKVAVMFIDLDRFKNINDSLGHATGDTLLQHVANRLQLIVREQDTLARVGGDEFVILLESLRDNSDAMIIAEKMMSAFDAPVLINDHSLYLSLSIGIALYPQDGLTTEVLIKNADAAMYLSKEVGGNACHFYTTELTDNITEKLSLENALRHAINNNELVLHYQPQYDLNSGRLTGAEALVRWQHPNKGLLQPQSFIGHAEESGLIIPLGEWVITHGCAQMQRWLATGINIETLSVNISGLQFQRGNLATVIQAALKKSGLAARHLELEITESILMAKPASTITTLHKLKALGVMISIDDFGTGYSSLSQLKQLPLDKLKIDQSFVHDIPFDKSDEAITCAIIALGQSLNIRISAEGIETNEQRNFLIRHGCAEGQGFLYNEALTGNAFTHMALNQQNSCPATGPKEQHPILQP